MGRPLSSQEYELDPMFNIPEGTTEFHSGSVPDDSGDDEGLEDQSAGTDHAYDFSEAPDVPDILSIISQTPKTNLAGQEVIDIVVEVEDVVGVSKYEFRVTKI